MSINRQSTEQATVLVRQCVSYHWLYRVALRNEGEMNIAEAHVLYARLQKINLMIAISHCRTRILTFFYIISLVSIW